MKKFLLSTFFICLFVALNAAEYTYVIVDEGTNAPSFTTQDGRFSFKASKGEGISGPAVGETDKYGNKDVRCYADNTLLISNLTGENITKIVFGISSNGSYKLAELSASTGKMADEPEYLAPSGYKEWQYSWTGNAPSVTFTVGDSCKFGVECTEQHKEAVGTLFFKQITITTDGATAIQQVFDNNIIYASNGTIFGLPSDAQIFSITGQNITNQNGHLRNGIYVVRCSGHTQKIIVK